MTRRAPMGTPFLGQLAPQYWGWAQNAVSYPWGGAPGGSQVSAPSPYLRPAEEESYPYGGAPATKSGGWGGPGGMSTGTGWGTPAGMPSAGWGGPAKMSMKLGQAPAVPPAPSAAPAALPAISNRTLAIVAAGMGLVGSSFAVLGAPSVRTIKESPRAVRGHVVTMGVIGTVGGILSLGILGYVLLVNR